MTRRSGSADLPLHGGRVPQWLATRMTKLGAVMGMDWHSSGITTSVLGALKRGLTPLSGELGIHVCGGRGKHSRATPSELAAIGERVGLDGAALASASRLVAKVDSAAVQDGFDLYLHGFLVADDGKWTVVQQGMHGERGQARRYHWLSEGLTSFVDAPHAAIDGPNAGRIVNLADKRAAASREKQILLLEDLGAERIAREYARMYRDEEARTPSSPRRRGPRQADASSAGFPASAGMTGAAGMTVQGELLPHLAMPDHHDVRQEDIVARRLHGALAAAETNGPKDFQQLLQVPGVGARTVKALALVAEVLHGTPCRFTDPARFSLAHGGKDRHPFPVPTKVYDHTIGVLKTAVRNAKLGREEELKAIQRLDAQARALEATAKGPTLDAFLAEERRNSHAYGGRSIFGWEPPAADKLAPSTEKRKRA